MWRMQLLKVRKNDVMLNTGIFGVLFQSGSTGRVHVCVEFIESAVFYKIASVKIFSYGKDAFYARILKRR